MRWILTGGALIAVSILANTGHGAELKQEDQAARAERIKTMFDSLKAGTHGAEAPKLEWQDIPLLLQRADSTAPIKSAPFVLGGLRRGKNDPLTEGMMALYLIETMRGEDRLWNLVPEVWKVAENPVEQEAELLACGVPGDAPKSVNPQTELTARYVEWWGRVKNLDAKTAVKDNPLKGSKFRWAMVGC